MVPHKLGKSYLIYPRTMYSLMFSSLDIMAATSPHLEQGYEKISRWCSHEFLRLGRDFHLEASAIMREAVKRLQQRPELLTYASREVP